MTCPKCHGWTTVIIETPNKKLETICDKCGGKGWIYKHKLKSKTK